MRNYRIRLVRPTLHTRRYTEWTTRAAGSGYRSSKPHRLAQPKQPFQLRRESQALDRSMELRNGGDAFDWFFVAMARWQLGGKDKAREWYDRAAQWMDKHQPTNEELRRFRAEAAELLGVEKKQD